MAKLSLRHIYKVYPNGVKAVNDFNMEIADKEFIVFVGPSGCGKSTTLRMIAGLEQITAGELFIGDTLVNDMEPKDRDIAMVFQNYALYPHMTVYDNMAFGLRLRHVPADEIHRKVLWAADVLKLTEYLNRKPRAMSGGQRQRVALGRAILRNPKVFLLDEPLSNLDAKLRTEMRAEIAKLHNELKTTFIYVTHDQVEAMTLGTRVVVMKLGYVQQIDTPQNLYEYPENKFVAGFIGTPQMNFFEATLRREKDKVYAKFDYCDNELVIPFADLLKVKPSYLHGDKHVYVGLRCEHISLDPEVVKKSNNIMKVKVSHFEELGNETLVYGDLNMGGDGFIESSTRVIIKSYHGALNLQQGDVVDAAFDMKKAHFFDKDDELTISPRVPTENVFDVSIKDNTLHFLSLKVKLPEAIYSEDVKNAELLIPTEAISIGKGNISAKVAYIEEVKGVRLAYLVIDDRTFFALADDNLKVDDVVKISIDFKKISVSKDGVDYIKALSTYDSFVGPFTNLENVTRSTNAQVKYRHEVFTNKQKEIHDRYINQLADMGHTEYALKRLKKNYKESLVKAKDEFINNLAISTGQKEDKRLIKEQYQNKLAKMKQDYEAATQEINSKAGLNEEEVKALAAKTDEEIRYYEGIYHEYALVYSEGAKQAQPMMRELLKDAQTKLKEDIAKADATYNEEVAAINAKYQANQGASPDEIKANEHTLRTEIKEAKARHNLAVDHAVTESKVFYISINGHYVKVPTDITLKVVQALGVTLFTSSFRYEVPHDAYQIAEEGYGFKGMVDNVLNYGAERFAVINVVDQNIYVKVDQDVVPGDTIYLTVDIHKIRIFENKFDIRLI